MAFLLALAGCTERENGAQLRLDLDDIAARTAAREALPAITVLGSPVARPPA